MFIIFLIFACLLAVKVRLYKRRFNFQSIFVATDRTNMREKMLYLNPSLVAITCTKHCFDEVFINLASVGFHAGLIRLKGNTFITFKSLHGRFAKCHRQQM